MQWSPSRSRSHRLPRACALAPREPSEPSASSDLHARSKQNAARAFAGTVHALPQDRQSRPWRRPCCKLDECNLLCTSKVKPRLVCRLSSLGSPPCSVRASMLTIRCQTLLAAFVLVPCLVLPCLVLSHQAPAGCLYLPPPCPPTRPSLLFFFASSLLPLLLPCRSATFLCHPEAGSSIEVRT